MEASSSPKFRGPSAGGGASTGGRGSTGGGAEPAEPSWPRLLVSAPAVGALLVSGCQAAAEAEERPKELTIVEVRLGHASCRGLRPSTYGNHEGQR